MIYVPFVQIKHVCEMSNKFWQVVQFDSGFIYVWQKYDDKAKLDT